jgi:hypothetical protein
MRNFSIGLTALVALFILLVTIGNFLVRTSYACKYCKQQEIGCPAEKLFQGGKWEKRKAPDLPIICPQPALQTLIDHVLAELYYTNKT